MKTIVACSLLCAGAALVAAEVDDDKQAAMPTPLAEIHERGVEGRLGARLGTIVTVAGTVVPNTSNRKEDLSAPYFLSIESVDGRELDEPVLYRFEAHRRTKVEPPQIDDRFSYAAYETGEFAGAPEGLWNYMRGYATTGYQFETRLFVLPARE